MGDKGVAGGVVVQAAGEGAGVGAGGGGLGLERGCLEEKERKPLTRHAIRELEIRILLTPVFLCLRHTTRAPWALVKIRSEECVFQAPCVLTGECDGLLVGCA